MRKLTEKITATANQSQRTFTIRKFLRGKLYAKYRTCVMTQEEFEAEEQNTESDWKNFLKSTDYYRI